MELRNLVKDYFKIQQEIYDYFGYQEDWAVIPFEDDTEGYWMIVGDRVVWSYEPLTAKLIKEGKDIFDAEKWNNNWIYRKPDCTMVVVDTKTEGNKFLMILDNDKECTDPDLKELFSECW